MVPELKGQRVTSVLLATNAQVQAVGWDPGFRTPLVVTFDSGYKLIASQDEEGNGPGALFLMSPDDTTSYYPVEEA